MKPGSRSSCQICKTETERRRHQIEGDTPSAPSTPESKTRYAGQGVAIGIQETREGKYWRTYRVPGHSSFRGFFYLLNQQPAEEYLLTCLVDYHQVPCAFNGQQLLLYRMSVEDLGERTLPFATLPLAPGLHDPAVLAFAKPDVHDLSSEYRLSTDFGSYGAKTSSTWS
jgi:hypothetical protein